MRSTFLSIIFVLELTVFLVCIAGMLIGFGIGYIFYFIFTRIDKQLARLAGHKEVKHWRRKK